MEIGTYLRGILRRWWVVVLITVLAGAGAVVLVGGTRDTYTANVNITVPPSLAATTGANGQYVANFKVGLTTESVISAVSSATGASKDRLKSHLSASQVNSSSFINVSYNGNTLQRATDVVALATKLTADLLAKGAIETATAEVDSAQKALDDANTMQDTAQNAVAAYTAAHGYIDPNVLYQSTQSAITQLEVSKQQAIAAGHPTSSFDAAISGDQAQLNVLAKEVGEFDGLSHTLDQAQAAATAAQTRVATAAQDLALAQAPPLIDTPTSKLTTAKSTIIRSVAIAAGIGFVLGLALVLLIEYVLASRRLRDETDQRQPLLYEA